MTIVTRYGFQSYTYRCLITIKQLLYFQHTNLCNAKEDSDLCYYQIHQCIDRDSTSYNEASLTPNQANSPRMEDDFPELEYLDYTEALPIPKELDNLEMPFVEMQ